MPKGPFKEYEILSNRQKRRRTFVSRDYEEQCNNGDSYDLDYHNVGIVDEPLGQEESYENFIEGIDLNNTDGISSDDDPLSDSDDDSVHEKESFIFTDFLYEFTQWAADGKVTHCKINELLKILKCHPDFQTLPVDSRTLLHTPRTTETTKISGGEYFHFGVEEILTNLIGKHQCLKEIEKFSLQFNIDGLPLSKSTSSQVWPILMTLFDCKQIEPQVIGIFHGERKPESCDEYLTPFVTEMSKLKQHGLVVNDRHIEIDIHSYVLDVPARTFVTNTNAHNSYGGCFKCKVHGEYYQNTIVFDEFDNELKTDHNTESKTSLGQIPGFRSVSHFPLDWMHLICLGVMKKILQALTGVRTFYNVKLCYRDLCRLNERLRYCFSSIPCEFARKSRSLSYIARWKATEFRQYLLYTGPYVMKGIVSSNIYTHFLALHYACRILLSKNLSSMFISYAKDLLLYVASNFGTLYGTQSVSHNIHNLIHIGSDAEFLGSTLEEFSAFKYENKLQCIKKMVRKPELPLQQIIRRINEIECASRLTEQKCTTQCEKAFVEEKFRKYLKTLPKGFENPTFSSVKFRGFKLMCTAPNNCVLMKNGDVVIINFIGTRNGVTSILGKKFENLEDFYSSPHSSKIVGVYKASHLSHNQIWLLEEIRCKAVMIPMSMEDVDESWYIAEMLHD